MARCARCGRLLKNPDSIARGLGSECAGQGSGSRPLKNWNRRITNSARLKNGLAITTNGGKIYAIDTMKDNEKQWLIKNKYILQDGDVDDKLLDEYFIDMQKHKGDNNDEEGKG